MKTGSVAVEKSMRRRAITRIIRFGPYRVFPLDGTLGSVLLGLVKGRGGEYDCRQAFQRVPSPLLLKFRPCPSIHASVPPEVAGIGGRRRSTPWPISRNWEQRGLEARWSPSDRGA